MIKFNFDLVENVLIPKFPDHSTLIIVLSFIACALIGYFIGSINFSIIFSRVFYKDDIRTHGSGNAGSTNMLRTHGTAAGLLTFFCDCLKTAVSVIIGSLIFISYGAYMAGFFCVIGHIFPIYFKFKGGKGVATVAALMALTNIPTFAACLVIFLIMVIGTKYVSLGSIVAVIFYPLVLSNFLTLFKAPADEHFGIIFAVLIAIIVVIKHRSNIKKIYNHTESKIKFSKHGSNTDSKSDGNDKK